MFCYTDEIFSCFCTACCTDWGKTCLWHENMFCYTDEKFHAFVPHVQWNTTVRPSVVEQIDDSIWKGRKWLEEQWFVQHVDDMGITCFFVWKQSFVAALKNFMFS